MTTEQVAAPRTTEAVGPNCDALHAEWLRAQQKEDSIFRALLLLVYATAIFIIIAAVVVLAGLQAAEVASAGVALFSGASAGALGTLYWRAHGKTIERLREWISKCPDSAPALLEGLADPSRLKLFPRSER